MAAIAPIPSQAPPAAAPSSAANDPLFDALVKYITTGSNAQSTSSSQLEDIINAHTDVPGGRAYLESLVSPSQIPDTRIWLHSANANGFISTNLDSLTASFIVPSAYLKFKGTGRGFFGMQVDMFDSGVFHWDDDWNRDRDTGVTFQVMAWPQWQQIIISFYPEVYIGEKKAIAELTISNINTRLPPQGVPGAGKFTPFLTTQ